MGYNRLGFKVVDYFMNLPAHLEREVEAIVEDVRRKQRRSWLSPWERRILERGARKGILDGLQQGLQQSVLTNLSARFQQVPDEARELIQKISQIETLENLMRHSVTAESLEQFMQTLREVVASEPNTENPPPQP